MRPLTEEQRTDGRIIQSERNPDDSCQTVRGRRTQDAGRHTCLFYISDTFFRCVTPLNSCCSLETADINISSAGHSVSVAFKEESGTKTWNTLNIQPVIVSLYKHDSSEIWNWVQLSNADVYLDVVASNKTGKKHQIQSSRTRLETSESSRRTAGLSYQKHNCKCPRSAQKTWFCRHKCSDELMKLI